MPCFPKSCRKRKKNKKKNTEEKRALQKLEDSQKMLQKQQEDLEKEIESCIVVARNNATTNKRVALRALQKKKYLEKKLERVDSFLTSVELQKDALEDSPTTAAVVVSLKNAGDVLKKSNISLDVGKVQDLMDDISEQYSVSNEVSNAIRNSIVFETSEEELLEELEGLEADEINKTLMTVRENTTLPLVSTDPAEDCKSQIKRESGTQKDEMERIKSEPCAI